MTWYHTRDKVLGGGTSYVLPTQMEQQMASNLLRDGILEWFRQDLICRIQLWTYKHEENLDNLILRAKHKGDRYPK